MKISLCMFVFVSCAIVSVNSHRCYWCSTEDNTAKCNDKFQSGDGVHTEDDCAYCLKYIFKNTNEIVRNCTKNRGGSVSYENGCATVHLEDYSYEECACTKELCNGASSEMTAVSGMLLVCLSLCSLYMF